jgi:transcriptional regulator with XRE-family HTH domain
MSDFFGIDFNADQDEYAEEGFIVEVQYELSKLLKSKGVSRTAFAKSMGVSPAYVSQILGDEGANLTCRTIAKAFIALGEVPVIRTKSSLSQTRTAGQTGCSADSAAAASKPSAEADWSPSRGNALGWEAGDMIERDASPSNDDGWSNVVPLFRRAA